MHCDEFERDFPDGLGGPGASRLVEHLDACPTCRSRWHALQLGLRVLRASAAEPSLGFEAALRERLSREARPLS